MQSSDKKDNSGLIAVKVHIKGLVQGVGFRPFVYRIAIKSNLKGWVENNNEGVFAKVEGDENSIKEFLNLLKYQAPPASNIESIIHKKVEVENFNTFEIIKSSNLSDSITDISPDIAVCSECIEDLKTQKHRINYPFINCTNCGPRFTIIQDLPYDRDKTTMSKFAMCDVCRKEYTDVLDRRFHAQPVACNDCGPKYELHFNGDNISNFDQILNIVSSLIDDGKIVAMKGLGGFHLACDALNPDAVKRLRELKHRDSKPLAIMVNNIETIKKFAFLNKTEEKIINSWRKPIVLLKENKQNFIPKVVSNNLGTIGIMLPYLPFHHLLFEKLKTSAIVLTSGNISEMPIIINNETANSELKNIYDALLTHDRDIYNRTDDSVVFITNEKKRIIRRSRGYVPNAINLKFNVDGIIAAGAELKNCFCVGKDNQAILSQHIGDLKNFETFDFYKQTIDQFKKLFRINPQIYVADKHPNYLSTGYINRIENVEKIYVQHHHAHIASCMAENNLDEKVIGISFDGTGYGDDGNTWGSEFFVCDYLSYGRINHFEYIAMPGGDKSADEPWRMAVSYLYKYFGKDFLKQNLLFLKDIPKEKIELVITALEKNINCPLTSGAGRLFDAVSALINLCTTNGFEAEAPMRLESIIDKNCKEAYQFDVSDDISFKKMFVQIIEDLNNKVEISVISAKFHNTIVNVVLQVAIEIRKSQNINKIALSGGVFQNKYLLKNVENKLKENSFDVYTHTKVPSNDGGIALGQIVIASKRLKTEKV